MAISSDACTSAPEAAANPRDNLYQEAIKGYINEGNETHLSLVVIGRSGQGKSALINIFAGQPVATEGDDFEPETTGLNHYRFNQNGVKVDIWDTPGFGMADAEKDEKTFQEMARDIKPVHLILYCIRMDQIRWPEKIDEETIDRITKIFTKKVWSRCLFVLTFANYAQQQLSVKHGEDTLTDAFSLRCTKWVNRIREQISKRAQLSNKEADDILVVPVGSSVSNIEGENPWKLADREDWLRSFWLNVAGQLGNALPSLLQLHQHELAWPEDKDQNSVSPVVDEVEDHGFPVPRPIPSTVAEKSDPQVSNDKPQIHTASATSQRTSSDKDSGCSERRSGRFKPMKILQRKLPLFLILRNELDKRGSGFFKYVTEFAKLRAKNIPGLGYAVGFIEGFFEYLGSSKRKMMIKQKSEN